MKAQIAMEYLMIASLALIILIPVILFATQTFIGYKENREQVGE